MVSKVPHSTKIFRKARPRKDLMDDLTSFIIDNNLQCFCHRYAKNDLFEKTKLLEKFNSEIVDFKKAEFQALFFFMTSLNIYIKDVHPDLLKKDIRMYFDRNVYGLKETESFVFPSKKFIISDMTFCEKSKIDLLFLPDFLGFILRKSIEYKTHRKEDNEILKNAHENYLKLYSANILHFINIRKQIIEQTIGIM